jgi:hypothetical protein
MENRFPMEGVELTHILVVADLDRARWQLAALGDRRWTNRGQA